MAMKNYYDYMFTSPQQKAMLIQEQQSTHTHTIVAINTAQLTVLVCNSYQFHAHDSTYQIYMYTRTTH